MQSNQQYGFTTRQLLFKELFVGTLIYAAVVGLLNDYTMVIYARSFSIIVLASVVLELLTCATFYIKDRIMQRYGSSSRFRHRALWLVCLWLLLFFSKFVFIWTVDFVFGGAIAINSFFGVLFLVVAVTTVHKTADLVFAGLGDKPA